MKNRASIEEDGVLYSHKNHAGVHSDMYFSLDQVKKVKMAITKQKSNNN